jgi:hypothetical protein
MPFRGVHFSSLNYVANRELCRTLVVLKVSNWRISDLKQILPTASIQPVCNQVEAHPYLQQPQLLQWCADRGIAIAVRFSRRV